jgi:hypothetical protein
VRLGLGAVQASTGALRSTVGIEPRMEVIANLDEVQTGLFGEHGVTYQV